MKIVIIPARSGSKRIKNKNIKNFLGEPIIITTIKKIISMNFFDKIYVSTNSKRISKIVKKNTSANILIRSQKLSNDYASTYDVMRDAILKLKEKKLNFKNICCIYPTSLFFEKKDMIRAFEKVSYNHYEYSFSVTKTTKPIQKLFNIKYNKPILISQENDFKRTQDFTSNYFDAGQFYWGKNINWIEKKSIFTSITYCIKIPNWKIIDIDDIHDWNKAEFLTKYMKKNMNTNIGNELKTIDNIEKVRSANNVNWMDILRIAMKASPVETKKIIKNINSKDKKISNLLNDLSK